MPSPAQLLAGIHRPPPWLLPHWHLLERVISDSTSQSVAAALNSARTEPVPVRFVDPSAHLTSEAYEAFIARTATVPTRDNQHDLFNGLLWLTYPQTKRRLNLLQAQEIELRGTPGPRGPLRDALTLFDENAALLKAPVELIDSLRRRDWQRLFVSDRSLWQQARVSLFGHALLEKLMQPRKAITAHVWVVDDMTDETLASSLTPERLTDRPFLPLPVLGIPGWWPDNEGPAFYDDPEVFRQRR
ncbi:hypothetical protein HNQ60_004845 [Povalibacter uvarum]|uniref:DUF3025 domain-containing protein n=1 Tax=Povalibacter uvarum TaxID=732238 RepID=A0A841HTI8_9GAMM|nr:DUF3025 domain-containing protein [Povalibacter uvarum]MBB6095954.1 hypothetical protein [Povalibacter uvarum]